MSTETRVRQLPDCQICVVEYGQEEAGSAAYDAKLADGQWGYVCQYHFRQNKGQLGTGRGQQLILVNTDEEWLGG
jgi:hypothetical protein